MQYWTETFRCGQDFRRRPSAYHCPHRDFKLAAGLSHWSTCATLGNVYYHPVLVFIAQCYYASGLVHYLNPILEYSRKVLFSPSQLSFLPPSKVLLYSFFVLNIPTCFSLLHCEVISSPPLWGVSSLHTPTPQYVHVFISSPTWYLSGPPLYRCPDDHVPGTWSSLFSL